MYLIFVVCIVIQFVFDFVREQCSGVGTEKCLFDVVPKSVCLTTVAV